MKIMLPDVSQDAWEREIAIVTAQMDIPPYNQPPDKLERAAALVRQGRITHVALSTYRVTGDSGVYSVTHNLCTCPNSTYGKTKHCKHVTAVQIYQRCLAGGAQPPGEDMLTTIDHKEHGTLQVGEEEESPLLAAVPPPRDVPAPRRTVYQAMHEVAAGLADTGVAKRRKNQTNNSMFRGIDDIQNVMAPLLADAGLLIVPYVETIEISERPSSSGGTLRFALARIAYTFIEVSTGDSYATTVCGEAMDTGDRAVQKAMTYAYKEMVIQSFCIPVEGQEDEDKGGKPAGRPVPDMAHHDSRDYRAMITNRMRHHGKNDAAIADYWAKMEKRYPHDLEKRLPGIWQGFAAPKPEKDEEPW